MGWVTALRCPAHRAHNRETAIYLMRSLALKLTLSFLLIGVIGAVFVALLVEQRIRREFDRFVSDRDQTTLINALADYYATYGSWDGIEHTLADKQSRLFAFYRGGIILFDAQGKVVIGNHHDLSGRPHPLPTRQDRTPIVVDNQTVGYLLIPPPVPDRTGRHRLPDSPSGDNPARSGHLPPEVAFLRQVAWASATSAGIAGLIALILGSLLALSLTRPIRELTAATQALGRGTLGQQVTVRSHDEIGELARSFNRMSSELARASQLRKQMTADIAHDLRTPLSIIRGYTEGLKDGRLQGSIELYAIMHDEVEHLQHLVEDLRLLSLVDAGELPLQRRVIDPSALLERAGLAHIVQAEQQGLTLRVEAPACMPSIAVDIDRMTQVLNNLLSNALRHTTQGTIILSATTDTRHVSLHVSDTGCGIHPDDIPYIFDRFYRVDKARQRSESGSSGLGLAIAKAIVEAHGGSIAVESAPGRGTTFTITLDAAVPSTAVLHSH